MRCTDDLGITVILDFCHQINVYIQMLFKKWVHVNIEVWLAQMNEVQRLVVNVI